MAKLGLQFIDIGQNLLVSIFFTDVFLSHQINVHLCVHIITLLGRATFQIESTVISLQNSHTSSEALLTVPTAPTENAAFLT